MSLNFGVVPDVWKIADVCPLPKVTPVKRDKLRPISLLPIVSKLCERDVLNNYHNEFVQSYDPSQFAYRPFSSSVCALIYIHDIVLKFLELSHIVGVRILCLDMTRAFDCVPHDLLLSLLVNLPFTNRNILVNWLNTVNSQIFAKFLFSLFSRILVNSRK